MMTLMGPCHRRHGKGRDQNYRRQNARELFIKGHEPIYHPAPISARAILDDHKQCKQKSWWTDTTACLQQKMQYAAAAEAARTPIVNRVYIGLSRQWRNDAEISRNAFPQRKN